METSAPLRVDCGGTIDLVPLSFYHWRAAPMTVNIALDLRVHVAVGELGCGRIAIESEGFQAHETPVGRGSLTGPMGLVQYLCEMWNTEGATVSITSDAPPRSGLGGSAATLVAVIAALDASAPLGPEPMEAADIAMLAYRLESSVSNCGPQDHLASALGGVTAWEWTESPSSVYRQCVLLGSEKYSELESALVLAYTGEPRSSATMLDDWIGGFLRGDDRHHWRDVIEEAKRFADAIKSCDWERAAAALGTESAIRRRRWPHAFTPRLSELIDLASQHGCGSNFAGAGHGGCVWAIGPPASAAKVREAWAQRVVDMPSARLLPATVSAAGVDIRRAPGPAAA
jgi:D-glycero-alpha-D-manno-heptose-7-phosphate kinase